MTLLILLCCAGMPLLQLDEVPIAAVLEPDRYTSASVFNKGYWRLDIEEKLPVLVGHVNAKVEIKVVLLGAAPSPLDPSKLLCCVDIPQTLHDKIGRRSSRLVSFFGAGRTLPERIDSLGLDKLRRSEVVSPEADFVPGYPNVLVHVCMSETNSRIDTLIGPECYEGWHPDNELFEDAATHWRAFLEKTKPYYSTVAQVAMKAHELTLPSEVCSSALLV